MANAAVAAGQTATLANRKYGSISRDRRWALRWSYFFLVLFAIFFLMPPIYMFITSLKTSAEISAAAEQVAGASSTMTTRPVFRTDARSVAASMGTSVRGSTTSIDTPSAASCSATASDSRT